MKFRNEYTMTKKRFVKWSIPVFYKEPFFWILFAMFAISGYAWYYFAGHDAPQKWQTLAAFIMVFAVYRGFLYKPLAADKHYRVLRQKKYNNEPWDVVVEVDDKGIKYKTNGRIESFVKWENITAFDEKDTYFDLYDSLGQQARFDKECWTVGDNDSFRQYIIEQHPDVPFKPIRNRAYK